VHRSFAYRKPALKAEVEIGTGSRGRTGKVKAAAGWRVVLALCHAPAGAPGQWLFAPTEFLANYRM